MTNGPLTTQYIGGIVADQLSKLAATIIGSITCQDFSRTFDNPRYPQPRKAYSYK